MWLEAPDNNGEIVWLVFSSSKGIGRTSAAVTKSDALEVCICELFLEFSPKFSFGVVESFKYSACDGSPLLTIALEDWSAELYGWFKESLGTVLANCREGDGASLLGPEYSGGGIP